MSQVYDVAIIGAGIGGLASSALCAKNNLNTILLEKNSVVGGLANSFVKGRFDFDISLHELISFGDSSNKGKLYEILESLDISLAPLKIPSPLRVVVPKYYDFIYPGNKIEFIEKLSDFTGDSLSKIEYLFSEEYKEYLCATGKCFKSVLLNLKELGLSDLCISILGAYWIYLGCSLEELDILNYLGLLKSILDYGAVYPLNKSKGLSTSLLNNFLNSRGSLKTNFEVNKIEFLKDIILINDCIEAKNLIADISFSRVLEITKNFNFKDYSLKLNKFKKPSLSYINIYLGLNKTYKELGIKDYNLFCYSDLSSIDSWKNRLNGYNFIAVCHNIVNKNYSEKGTCCLSLTIPVNYNDFLDSILEDLIQNVIKNYEEITGAKIRNSIEEFLIVTPSDFKEHLGGIYNSIYGYRLSGLDSFIYRQFFKDLNYQLPNCYFVGGYSDFGNGYPHAFYSAEEALNNILKNTEKSEVNISNEFLSKRIEAIQKISLN